MGRSSLVSCFPRAHGLSRNRWIFTILLLYPLFSVFVMFLWINVNSKVFSFKRNKGSKLAFLTFSVSLKRQSFKGGIFQKVGNSAIICIHSYFNYYSFMTADGERTQTLLDFNESVLFLELLGLLSEYDSHGSIKTRTQFRKYITSVLIIVFIFFQISGYIYCFKPKFLMTPVFPGAKAGAWRRRWPSYVHYRQQSHRFRSNTGIQAFYHFFFIMVFVGRYFLLCGFLTLKVLRLPKMRSTFCSCKVIYF